MRPAPVRFDEIEADTPDLEQVRAETAALLRDLDGAQNDGAPSDGAPDDDARVTALRRWDERRRERRTWHSLVNLRFRQDTRDPEARAAREALDELAPKLLELELEVERRLCTAPWRASLERRLGTTVFLGWETHVTTYDPAVEREAVAERRAASRYTELLASARFEFRGETLNLSSLGRFAESLDRDVRHEASRLRWDWFAEHAEELDGIYDELVGLRATTARALGDRDYVATGYRRMRRLDYGRDEVEAYRAAVREHVVPLCTELRERQRRALGLDRLMAWDQGVHDPRGNPVPQGDGPWMVERARGVFRELDPDLGAFFATMADGGYLDLEAREGKAGGGFCTGFPSVGMPFIFANFNGTRGDVKVFTHEMGHAYQSHRSFGKFPMELESPSLDACEIHSMSLEYLTWPWMERFFGDDAERFRRMHLAGSLLFLPYGVAIDEFQHRVYADPAASPADRHAMWSELERTYLPGLDWGDLAHPAAGGRWQQQMHVYQAPFYYIDYTLAQVCALQFLLRSRDEPARALDDFRTLCGRGGEEPFRGLVESAGLDSPFEEGTLAALVQRLRPELLAG